MFRSSLNCKQVKVACSKAKIIRLRRVFLPRHCDTQCARLTSNTVINVWFRPWPVSSRVETSIRFYKGSPGNRVRPCRLSSQLHGCTAADNSSIPNSKGYIHLSENFSTLLEKQFYLKWNLLLPSRRWNLVFTVRDLIHFTEWDNQQWLSSLEADWFISCSKHLLTTTMYNV